LRRGDFGGRYDATVEFSGFQPPEHILVLLFHEILNHLFEHLRHDDVGIIGFLGGNDAPSAIEKGGYERIPDATVFCLDVEGHTLIDNIVIVTRYHGCLCS
jgi:hypothetical protein